MSMHDAMRVDAQASLRWHRDFHDGYEARVARAAVDLEQLKPDLLLSNIPYLSLEASAACGLPAVAVCSLNWADVFRPYCIGMPGAAGIVDQMVQAYARADVFLQPAPSMDMHAALRTRPIGPIAARGSRQPDRLRAAAGVPDDTRFVLMALGGLGTRYPMDRWPRMPGVCWIFPPGVPEAMRRDDCFVETDFGLDYVDLLASCDVVMTKTGYGTQTEAVVNQVPVLCIQRPDWPEEPFLPDWHQQHGEVRFVSRSRWEQGQFVPELRELLDSTWDKPAVQPSGAAEAAAELRLRLGAG